MLITCPFKRTTIIMFRSTQSGIGHELNCGLVVGIGIKVDGQCRAWPIVSAERVKIAKISISRPNRSDEQLKLIAVGERRTWEEDRIEFPLNVRT